jgi:hypothetical protein
MTSNGSAAGSGKVLPSSRQPMPGSAEYVRDRDEHGPSNGDKGSRRRKSVAEIEAELQETTDRLAANVDALAERLSPKEITRRSVDNVKGLARTPEGRLRPEVVGGAVGALAGIALLVWLGRRRRP